MTMKNTDSLESVQHWLALHRLPQVGPATAKKLLDHFGNPQNIFAADQQILQKILKPESLASLQDYVSNGEASRLGQQTAQDIDWLYRNDTQVITLNDSLYPPLLKQIHQPPIVLYVKGNIEMLSQLQLGMVGSRRPTISGKENAYQFAKDLGQMGFVITSGLAMGVDALSHQGALAVDGGTVAVLGTGINQVYPKKHIRLAEKVSENGCLVTEFPLRATPLPQNFPRRNRIISGLSVGVLVVEAALKSGSLITAKYALEQNREIFAIPGSINNPMAKGCHQLIRQGAKLAESAQHIVEELELLTSYTAAVIEPAPAQSIELDLDEKTILACIAGEPTSIDQISIRSCMDASSIASTLLMLELKGLVDNDDGTYQLTENRSTTLIYEGI